MEGSRYDDRRGDPGEGPHAAAGKAACGAGLYRVPAVPHAGERAAQTPTGALEGSGRLDYRRRHLRSAAGDVGQLSAGSRLKPGLVGTYGAFGSITRPRYEVIVEGTDEPVLTASTKWREYEFKGKQIGRASC